MKPEIAAALERLARLEGECREIRSALTRALDPEAAEDEELRELARERVGRLRRKGGGL